MSHSPGCNFNPNPNPRPPTTTNKKSRAHSHSLPDNWFREQSLRHAIIQMQLHHHPSRSDTPSASPPSEPDSLVAPSLDLLPDPTAALSDELLLKVFSRLPSSQYVSNSLVCKRWFYLHGRLVRSLKLTDWSFLESGRVFLRFPNLTEIDIVPSCIKTPRSSGVLVTHRSFKFRTKTHLTERGFIEDGALVPSNVVDHGVRMVAEKYPNLRRISVLGASEDGLCEVAEKCTTLQELELHCSGDQPLRGISGYRNLQVVKLIGTVDWLYHSVVSDIGLTLLAQGCRRLVKLELCGCEGSYDGIKAIGQCCQMLEELTLSDHRMDGGWLAALPYCLNLKTLRLNSCRVIDSSPGSDEHLVPCSTLEELHLQQCQMRDKLGMKALALVCENVREIVVLNSWGLDDDTFRLASICRYWSFLMVLLCKA